MPIPPNQYYKARKRAAARRRQAELEKQTKDTEIKNPVGPVVENPTGSRVVDPAGDYLANVKGAVVENPIGAYVENPSDNLGKHLPPMEQEDHNILMKKMGDAINSTAVQSKVIDMPIYDAEAKDYTSKGEITSRDADSMPVVDDGMGDEL